MLTASKPVISTAPASLSYEAFKKEVRTNSAFLPFRQMLAHEPLLKFLYHEKCLLGPVHEERVIVDSADKETGGYYQPTDMPLIDEYYPGIFSPFHIKGVWLPLAEGELFSILSSPLDCPLVKRDADDELMILFFIHPKSENLYQNLLATHRKYTITLSAFSLSSARSLLVAYPKGNDQFEPVMVKVTLDQIYHGVLRVLTRRECALTVANTSILSRKVYDAKPAFSIIEDPLAFVPAGYPNGMIFRKMPPFLNPALPNPENLYAVPLFALHGIKNREFFKALVNRDGGNVTDFLLNRLLKPFTEIFLKLLLNDHSSIEAHGQNLLLILDGSNAIKGLLYRDMGGVNQEISADDIALPANLRQPALSYFVNHAKDASDTLENHFVRRGLYPLTKQLVKDADYFQQHDLRFRDWYTKCQQTESFGFAILKNWTLGHANDDEHATHLSKTEFYRYGYVEFLFAECLLNDLHIKNLLPVSEIEKKWTHLLAAEELNDGSLVAPCTYEVFFVSVITQLLNSIKQTHDSEEVMQNTPCALKRSL